ncbi:AMP-binding protein [Streptomyces sp. NPDC004227]
MWPDRDQAVLRTVLERQAEQHPDRPAVRFEDGTTWTSRDARDQAYAAANVMAAHGVRQGDHVGVLLPNGPDFLRAWWGLRCLGAAIMPINPALKGLMLTHPLGLAEPRLIVTTPELSGPLSAELTERTLLHAGRLAEGAAEQPPLERPIELADDEVVLMTSGTTGPSKVWVSSVMQASTTGAYVRDGRLNEADRFLVELPLFHTAGLGVTAGCLRAGTLVLLRSRPSLSRWFDVARELGATAAFLVGSMAAKLLATPETPLDREHNVRLMVAAPLPPDLPRFVERFGIERVLTSFGSTETGGPIGTGDTPGLPTPGSSGRARPGWGEYRLVDQVGADVPDGQVGELLLRPAHPETFGGRYLTDPEATAAAWAGGWFHTGDLFRRTPDGDFCFVERDRDAIRRRGENISSFEVEREVLREPGIAAAACVGVDEVDASGGVVGVEVKIWVVPADPGAPPDFAALAERLSARLPAYMVPRFYETTDSLPTTPTQRVRKFELRRRGNGPEAWDRLAASRPAQ